MYTTLYAVYQSEGALLGVGETVYEALEDARWDETMMGNALGEPIDFDTYTNYTRMTAPGLEVAGEIYVRRCALVLFEAARDTVPSSVPYHVNAVGVVEKGEA